MLEVTVPSMHDLAAKFLIGYPFMIFAWFVIFMFTVSCGVLGGHKYTRIATTQVTIYSCRRCAFRKLKQGRRRRMV